MGHEVPDASLLLGILPHLPGSSTRGLHSLASQVSHRWLNASPITGALSPFARMQTAGTCLKQSMLLHVTFHDDEVLATEATSSLVLLAGIFQFSVAYTLLKPSPVDLEVQRLLHT